MIFVLLLIAAIPLHGSDIDSITAGLVTKTDDETGITYYHSPKAPLNAPTSFYFYFGITKTNRVVPFLHFQYGEKELFKFKEANIHNKGGLLIHTQVGAGLFDNKVKLSSTELDSWINYSSQGSYHCQGGE